MTDIWDNVAASLHETIDYSLFLLRQQPAFLSMGSEIERAFAAHIVIAAQIHPSLNVSLGLPSKADHGYFLASQVQIGSYRVDFVFAKARHFDRPSKWIVIECDGHEFHDRTKEQAARDKSRDRYLSAEAGKVLRFTGSEIFRDIAACWRDVNKVMETLNRDDK